jgi:hypothetical protein
VDTNVLEKSVTFIVRDEMTSTLTLKMQAAGSPRAFLSIYKTG